MSMFKIDSNPSSDAKPCKEKLKTLFFALWIFRKLPVFANFTGFLRYLGHTIGREALGWKCIYGYFFQALGAWCIKNKQTERAKNKAKNIKNLKDS